MKYKIDTYDDDNKAVEAASNTCPCGSQLAGIMMGFFLGIITDLTIHIEIFTLIIMSIGSAFGTLGSQFENPFSINQNDFIIFTIMHLFMSFIFSIFFSVKDGMCYLCHVFAIFFCFVLTFTVVTNPYQIHLYLYLYSRIYISYICTLMYRYG